MQLSTRFFKAPFVCADCASRLSYSAYQASSIRGRAPTYNGGPSASTRTSNPVPATLRTRYPIRTSTTPIGNNAYSTAATERPFRLAVIGSGPAGFYTTYRLMKKIPNAVVDMYEQLPVPYGLVRFGVAPDHPEVKNCEVTFEEVAQSPRFNYIGNVKVGQDIELAAMKPHYDAILFSYGASYDRKLGIPGEDLPGVFSAREFVGWYNGLPQFRHLAPDLNAGDQAVVIGQGNVALDVARILLKPIESLKSTDISAHALETLAQSKIKSVKVIGRRGPLQAAFSVKEVRELMHIPDVAFEPIDPSFYPSNIKLPRVQKRIGDVLLKGSNATLQEAKKSWALSFLRAPKSINTSNSEHASSITLTHQEFAPGADPLSKSAPIVPTKEESTVPATLVFRSVGYKSSALPGLCDLGVAFDSKLGIIPNDPYGRVVAASGGPGPLAASHIAGLYCAGWVKRGPTGVIASTMDDAFTSADIIVQDWENGVPFLNSGQGEDKSTGQGWDAIKETVIAKGVRPLNWRDWKAIDEAERARGAKMGKSREKFASVEEMLKFVDA